MDERDMDLIRLLMKKSPMRTVIIVVAILIFLLILKPWVQVGAGERGVVLNFCTVQETVLDEGLHFRIPLVQEVIRMDVKVQKATTDAAAASSDLQDVSSTVAINYHIAPDKANIVYQTIGIQFKERIIDPAVQEVGSSKGDYSQIYGGTAYNKEACCKRCYEINAYREA